MAVLKGNEEHVGSRGHPKLKRDTNAVIGNKLGETGPPMYDEIILKKSSQVLPLVKFQQPKIKTPAFAGTLWKIHGQIHQVLDEFFNNSARTDIAQVQAQTLRGAVPVPNAYPARVTKTSSAVGSLKTKPTPSKPSRRRSRRSRSRKMSPSLLPPGTTGAVPKSGTSSGPTAALAFAAPQPAPGVSSVPAPASSSASVMAAHAATAPPLAPGTSYSRTSSSASLMAALAATAGTGTAASSTYTSRPAVRSKRPHSAAGPSRVSALTPSTASSRSIPAGLTYAAPPVAASISAAASSTPGKSSESLSLIGSTVVYTVPTTLTGSSKVAFQNVAAGHGGCSICLCELKGGGQVVQLPRCKHLFHEACISASLKVRSSIPIRSE